MHTASHCFTKIVSCRSGKFTTGDFECMMCLKKFTLQKVYIYIYIYIYTVYILPEKKFLGYSQESRSWTVLISMWGRTEVVLNGVPAFLEFFNPSCHCAIWQCFIATCFMQSLKTFVCTRTSCHFNFDPGMLLYFLNMILGH